MTSSAYHRNRSQQSACAQRLVDLMRSQGVSTAALAASVRIQRSTLENFCAGGPSIPFDVIERIALELHTTARFLTADPN
jgi:hypothetical protein